MDIINTVLPIFLVIGAGRVLGAVGFIGRETNASLSRLIFYVAAPVLLFRSAAAAPVSETVDPQALLVMLGVTLFVAFSVYGALARVRPSRRGVLAQGSFRANMVFVGLPVVQFAYGDEVLGSAAVVIGFMVIIYNFVSVLVLTLPRQDGGGAARGAFRRSAVEIVRNPLIIGCVLGIAFSLLDLSLPIAIDRSFELVGRIAMPLALLSVGAGLDVGKLRADLLPAALVSSIKLIVYPALIYAGLLSLGMSGPELQCPVIIMGAPAAVVSAIMAREMDGDEQLASAIVIGTTLGSVLSLSAWLAFFSAMS
ncbi:MAG: AEC family transporter [Planctomycetota bacterium]